MRVLLRYDFQPLKNKGIKLDPKETFPATFYVRPVVGDVVRSGKVWPQGRLELEVKRVVVDDPYLELQLDVTGNDVWVQDGPGNCKRLTWTEWYARLCQDCGGEVIGANDRIAELERQLAALREAGESIYISNASEEYVTVRRDSWHAFRGALDAARK